MILTPPATNTRQLTWDADRRTYHGEVSDTNGFGRVYDDACDEGLTLVSARTGRTVVMVVNHTEYDANGDVSWWELRTADFHRDPVFQLLLFND